MRIALLVVCQALGGLALAPFLAASRHRTRAAVASNHRTRAAAPRVATLDSPARAAATADDDDAYGAWLPVHSVAALSGLGPQKVQILGRDYAVWEDGDGVWSVVEDACPHRLAPLSQGRVNGDTGCLECPYHGWQFDAAGGCTAIPQGEVPRSKNVNANALPTRRTGDLVWAFFDEAQTGEHGLKSETPEQLYPWLDAHPDATFYFRELAYSFDVLVENFMDPAHIPFAHHGLQAVRSDGSPIAMTTLASNETHVETTFEDVIRGKERAGILSFRRPCRYNFQTKRDDGEYKVNLEIYATPVRAGNSRVFFASPLGSAWFVPTWLGHAGSNRFLNTDMWLHDAERVLRSDPRGDRAYVTPTSSDIGANAFRTFWRKSGMADAPPHSFGPARLEDLPPVSRADAIDPWATHAKQCASCRASLRSATRVERVGTAIACAAAFPSGAAATTALLATGLGLRAAAGWTKRVIRGELAPEHVADRSVAAADDKPSPGGRDNTANAE